MLSIVVVRTLFLPSGEAFFQGAGSLAPIAIFFVSCLTVVAAAQTLRTTFVKLEAVTVRSEILSQELHHRVRNMMGVVQAMAQQSARSDPDNFLGLFLGRLKALSSAHDALANNIADSCSLREVIDHSCTPFCHEDNITTSGPPCRIPSHSCVPLTLALHELCTNAIKHGAFSIPGGLVHVVWTVDSEGVAKISWQESGGPTVTAPKRRGLGTALLSSQRDIRRITVDYEPQGVHCLIEVDGAELAGTSLLTPGTEPIPS